MVYVRNPQYIYNNIGKISLFSYVFPSHYRKHLKPYMYNCISHKHIKSSVVLRKSWASLWPTLPRLLSNQNLVKRPQFETLLSCSIANTVVFFPDSHCPTHTGSEMNLKAIYTKPVAQLRQHAYSPVVQCLLRWRYILYKALQSSFLPDFQWPNGQ